MTNSATFTKSNKFWIAIVVLVLLPLLFFAAYKVVAVQDYQDSDFFIYWLGGRMLGSGENPYSTKLWISNHALYGADLITDPVMPYPLPLAILFIPLGWLPIERAFIGWVFLSEIFILLSVGLLLSLWKNPIRKHYIFPLIAGAFLFRPVLVSFHNGQLSAFLLLLITLTVYLWTRGKHWQGEALLMLIALKTNIGIFIVFLVAVWLLRQKKFRALLRIGLFSIVIVLAGMMLAPSWAVTFLKTGSNKMQNTFGYSPTLWGLAGTACNHTADCTMIAGGILSLIALSIIGYFLLTKADKPAQAMSLAVSGSLLIAPYLWAYDQTMLLFSVVMVVIFMQERGCPYWLTAMFPVVLSLVSDLILIASFNLGNDSLSAFIPLTCLALTLWWIHSRGHLQAHEPEWL